MLRKLLQASALVFAVCLMAGYVVYTSQRYSSPASPPASETTTGPNDAVQGETIHFNPDLMISSTKSGRIDILPEAVTVQSPNTIPQINIPNSANAKPQDFFGAGTKSLVVELPTEWTAPASNSSQATNNAAPVMPNGAIQQSPRQQNQK